ncbi:MAG: HNH endonuclease [Litorimonas sp.]
MTKAVFIHNPSSNYDDDPARHYHFPKLYYDRAKSTVGDWIVYYESGKNRGLKSYKAIAKVQRIRPDESREGHYYADIVPNSFLPMERNVPFKLNDTLFETRLSIPDGRVNGGHAIAAVRILPDADFARIIEYGLPDEQQDLPRVDDYLTKNHQYEVGETQSPFEFGEAIKRPQVFEEILMHRKVRDRAFRSVVLRAYNKTCAFTGFNFINGGGRAEVQAAHIKPVEHDGPDSVNNGLALSGTAHWMFDRGLLSLADDGEILVSRHINNVDEVNRVIVSDRQARLPPELKYRPHPDYLNWHRENCFKR